MTTEAIGSADADRGAASDGLMARLSRRSLVILSIWFVLFAVELIVSINLAGGRLVFTLDDAYIHLAVADQILSGGYGVNPGEFSSPSSSIIWP